MKQPFPLSDDRGDGCFSINIRENVRYYFVSHLEQSDDIILRCGIFLAALLSNVIILRLFAKILGSMWASTPTDCALIITLCSVDFCTHRRVRCPHRTLRFTNLEIFFSPLFYPLRRQGRHRLAAARSRHGSDSPPDVHSLPCRHFSTLKEELILKMNFIRLSTKPNIIKVSLHTIALVLLLTFF